MFFSISLYPSPLLTPSPPPSMSCSFSSISYLDYYHDRVFFCSLFIVSFSCPLFSSLTFLTHYLLYFSAGDGWKGRECFRIGHDVFLLTLTAIPFCY
ncbi:hypothetical protein BDQ94DRAFT_140935 [Aspergillus welwitschiae]|uniref:Uncharacterized protein n=1 Tax=Aspergillus welwitschiae TaxID=1341132 RepID=A0A3F3Q6M0_9EURO|nr:hypothetical protein BDQ94DRAFT_140935 [Aspergillus welwitschiae]RDH34811.1 hypothetical protein BDQ94DRAFT_140935 [Aspergillus welwitschiae]